MSLSIGFEKIKVVNFMTDSKLSLIVERGQQGTTPTDHPAGSILYLEVDAVLGLHVPLSLSLSCIYLSVSLSIFYPCVCLSLYLVPMCVSLLSCQVCHVSCRMSRKPQTGLDLAACGSTCGPDE